MRPFAVIFLSLMAVSLEAFAQAWEWQNPLPLGNDLNQVVFVNHDVGWACGDEALLKTTDAGETWHEQNTGYQFYSGTFCSFPDLSHGWIVGYPASGGGNSLLIRTTDGGQTWTQQHRYAQWQFSKLVFTDSLNGWAGAFNMQENARDYVLHTADGGATFNPVSIGEISLSNLHYALHDGTVWASPNSIDSRLYRSTDNGVTWTDIGPNRPALGWMAFATRDSGFSAGTDEDGYFLVHTSDGGATWVDMLRVTDSYSPFRPAVASSLVAIVMGSNGVMYRTTDGGVTWESTGAPAFAGYRDLTFADENTAWVTGWCGLLASSINTGTSWTLHTSYLVNSDIDFADVSFADGNNGWAVGGRSTNVSQGTIVHTRDGGLRWEQQDCPTNLMMRHVSAVSSDEAWAVPDSGGVLHTTDGGGSWMLNTLPPHRGLLGIQFTDEQHGWIAGYRSGQNEWWIGFFRTTDGGATWQASAHIDSLLTEGFQFIDNSNGWILGEGYDRYSSSLLRTSDGGQSWTRQFVHDSAYFRQCFFLDANTGWITDWSQNRIYRTADGGSHWQPVSDDHMLFRPADFVFTDSQHGWALDSYSSQGSIQATTDGGVTWSVQHEDNSNPPNAICVQGTNAWVVGNRGSILHWAGQSSAPRSGFTLHPSSFSLSSYPNPFNPTTRLEYTLPFTGRINLTVYDLTGRQVQTLVNEVVTAGNYQYTFDGSRLPSGIYFARLQGKGFSKTQKLMLLK